MTGAASPPGITVIVASIAGAARLATITRLVGATVGRRRAFRAVPRRSTATSADGTPRRPRCRGATPAVDGSSADDELDPAARRSPRTSATITDARGSGRAGPAARGDASVGAASGVGVGRRSHPLPPERVLVETRRAGRAALAAHGARVAAAASAAVRRTRVRRHRQITSSQITSAPPSIAQRAIASPNAIDTVAAAVDAGSRWPSRTT